MKQIPEPDVAASAASAGLKATLAGGGILTIGGLTANDLAILGGLLLAIGGFIVQLVSQARRDRREEQKRREEHLEHLARMEAIRTACNVDVKP